MLDHDGYLPIFAHIGDGLSDDRAIARSLDLPKGSVIVIDRGYCDYQLFRQWTDEKVFFVSRLRSSAQYVRVKSFPVPKGGPLMADHLVQFTAARGCPTLPVWRRISFWCQEKNEEIEILTNQLTWAPSTIMAVYKARWQIELFFKSIKQQLKIKTFVGTSANAVQIQIWTALISILIIRYLQFRSQYHWAVSNLVALLRLSLFTYRDLWQWINRPFDTPPELPPEQQLLLDSILSKTSQPVFQS